MITMQNNGFIKVDDVCKLLKVSRITVYRWLKSGKLTGYKVGRSYLFKQADINDFIERNKVNN